MIFFRKLLFLFFLTTLSAQAQQDLWTQVYDPKQLTQAKATALFSKLPSSGYVPVRLEFINGQKKDISWELLCHSEDGRWRERSNYHSTYTFRCAAESKATFDILVPIIPPFQASVLRSYSEPAVQFTMTCSAYKEDCYGRMSAEVAADLPIAVASADIILHNGSRLDSGVSGSGSRGNLTFAGSFEPQLLPEDWRGFAGYEVMFLKADEFRKISPGASVALRQWLRGGGRLVILSTSSSDTLRSLGFDCEELDQTELRVGSGSVLMNNEIKDLKNINADWMIKEAKKRSARIKDLSVEYAGPWRLLKDFGSQSFNPAPIAIVLLLFAFLVGPINLFCFAKSGQRHRLFFTTPIISLAASLLLIALIVFQDGFGGRGVRNQHIQLGADGEPYAVIYQEQVSRTGVLFSTGVELKEQLPLTPVLLPNTDWAHISVTDQGRDSRFSQDMTDDGVSLTGDFFQSRAEQAHVVSQVAPSYGKVELVEGAITSSLGYSLDVIYYRNSDGKLFKAENLIPGAKVIPTPLDEKWTELDAQKLFSAARRKMIFDTFQQPNSFLAITQEAPGIETHSSIKWTRTNTIITGPIN